MSDRADGAPRDARAGFTIIEMVVAVMILAIGVVGLAGTAAVVSKQLSYSKRETVAATVAEKRLERIQSAGCTQMASGTATTLGMSETWTVGTTNNNTRSVTETVTTGGSTSKTYTFTGYVQCK